MRNVVAAMVVAGALAGLGGAETDGTETGVEGYKDVARPLIIFAPSETDARFVQEVRALKAQTEALRERQVVVLVALERESSGEWRGGLDGRVWPKFGREARRGARGRFGVKAGSFKVVLVGKDGGEKLTEDGVLGFERLRETIDAMPMRQQERKGH